MAEKSQLVQNARAFMETLAVINGPNNNFYGIRNKEQYGSQTYDDLIEELKAYGATLGFAVEAFQSNSEGAIIDHLQSLYLRARDAGTSIPLVINPGAYTHYSYAIMDALESVHELVPAIECHMSNIHKREEFRHTSVTARECIGQVAGFGKDSYKIAMQAHRLRIDSVREA
jgi:3-dehydroquinate dehydratase-2